MSEKTKIEWCDATINFWWGCTKVSPGCAHCYAESLSYRFGDDIWGKGKPRRKIKGAVAMAEKLNRQYLERNPEPHQGIEQRPRVFCSSMADWLDPEVPIEWLAEMLDTIRRTPHLDWLLLTKRPELWRELIESAMLSLKLNSTPEKGRYGDGWELYDWLGNWNCGDAPQNVWIGTSVEDQKRADERIPALLEIPAKVRFLSCEPLLGPVDLGALITFIPDDTHWIECCPIIVGIHWVIVGGESGPYARPMQPDWARGLLWQCCKANVPFFFKQWGEWAEWDRDLAGKFEVYSMCPQSCGATGMQKVGKKAAGRLLDGLEWSDFPKGGAQ